VKDFLEATSILYGDCSNTPPDEDIYINGTLATAEQMTAITAKATELEAEWDANEYARNRASAYPAIPDQLDEIFHNGIDSWKAVIKVTKDKYPKG
jgi:hypothetical protein